MQAFIQLAAISLLTLWRLMHVRQGSEIPLERGFDSQGTI